MGGIGCKVIYEEELPNTVYEEMRNFSPYMRRPLVIYVWLCTRSLLISLYMRKIIFLFYQCSKSPDQRQFWELIQRNTWCMGPYADADYIQPHLMSTPESTPNTFKKKGHPLPESINPMLESTLSLSQGLWMWCGLCWWKIAQKNFHISTLATIGWFIAMY
jgi:hypothetical protein